MRPSEVRLTVAAQQAIERGTNASWPREMVAALGGRRCADVVLVEQVVPFPTAGEHDSFLVPPASFLDAERRIRRAGGRWLGFVHSHPGGAAAPSARDRAELWRACVQMIVGGARREALCAAAFWFAGDTCTDLRLHLPLPEPCA
jgi:proteasome lid subunit RPN8/RPN11